jgi:serine/threonine protein kinase
MWPLPPVLLGRGHSGSVWQTSDKTKVVKAFNQGNSSREVAALRRLANTGIVPKVHRVNVNSLVMNKVGDKTLRNYLKSANYNKQEVQNKVKMLVNIMHSRRVSHGNLKSDNIMVELAPNGSIRKLWVVDFGHWRNIPPGKTEKNIRNGPVFHRWNTKSAFGSNTKLKSFTGNWKPNNYMLKRFYEVKPSLKTRVGNYLKRAGFPNAFIEPVVQKIRNKKIKVNDNASFRSHMWSIMNGGYGPLNVRF